MSRRIGRVSDGVKGLNSRGFCLYCCLDRMDDDLDDLLVVEVLGQFPFPRVAFGGISVQPQSSGDRGDGG